MTDLLVRGARIWTGDTALPFAETALIRDGVFAFVGEERAVNAPTGTATLDLGGSFVMPGFGDAHVHLMGTGFAMQSVDLKGVPSVEEALRRVSERVALTAPGEWVSGAGWDQNAWPGERFPTRQQLDTVSPEHPVALTHTSGHCTWVNSAALRLAGVGAGTPSPGGGAIDLDEAGDLTGILRDRASDLVASAMPRPSPTARIAAVQAAIAHGHTLGLTSVHAMNVGRGEFQALNALHGAERLTLRTRMYLSHDRLDEWIERAVATGDGDHVLRVGGVKFFSDGALGSLTAWMHEPYATSETCGFPLQPIEELERDVARSLEAGLAPAIHAIGDRANHEVLNLYGRQSGRAPDLVRRIEHAQVLVEDDILRFAPLGIIASMQPIHATADWRKVDREWGSRGRLAYAFASLSRAGTSLAFGSDSPVETMDPLAGVRAAVARTTAQDEPAGGWHPEERLLLDDALRAYTAGVAAASGESSRVGTISAGQLADFVVLSDDPFALPNERKLSRIRVELTAVGGNVAFERT